VTITRFVTRILTQKTSEIGNSRSGSDEVARAAAARIKTVNFLLVSQMQTNNESVVPRNCPSVKRFDGSETDNRASPVTSGAVIRVRSATKS
jgi:hypothetical protein